MSFMPARGLPDNLILRRHILRNSLYSSLTALGMSIPAYCWYGGD